MKTVRLTLVGSLLAGFLSGSLDAAPPAAVSSEGITFFEKGVRPLLAQHCFACHGPKKQEGGLRLDSRSDMLQGGDSGPVIVAGNPQASALITAIGYADDPKMPPKAKLPEEAIAALTHWVKIGAPWPASPIQGSASKTDRADAARSHWAFQPIGRPAIPQVQDSRWPQTSIDHFILQALKQKDLSPSSPADRRTWIRRASFDLVGLSPSFEDVEAFLADTSPEAYAKVVDRLLDSPHYGERWGRYWLDVARYADTKGYVFFEDKKFPWAYTYRDYVVRALNEDLPFDRFVLEQLAADQLDLGDDRRALAAMGFLTVGDRFMNNLHDILDDRIDVVTRGLMGLTVTCARCHDHKYDPIYQDDYYALYGVFRSSVEPMLLPLFRTPPATEEYEKFAAELEKRKNKFQEFVTGKHEALVRSARDRVVEYLLAAHARRGQPRTEDFMLLTDQGDLNPAMILRWQVYLEKTAKNYDPVWAPWHALAEVDEGAFATEAAALVERLSEDPPARPINSLVLEALSRKVPSSMQEVADRYGEVLSGIDRRWQALLKQSSEKNQPPPTRLADASEEQLRQVFYGHDAPANVPAMLGWGFLDLLPDRPSQGVFKKLVKDLETWTTTGPGAPPRAMVLVDAQEPYDARVFLRGNPNRQGREVPRRFLGVLNGEETKTFVQGSGRLELARAIVDPTNPLTARVIVNRVWLHHFGRGLVGTPSDFGLQGERPSHPELLDHLASEFMEGGWSVKKLHRRIMLSAAYQQASDDRSAPLAVDPENRLLWKMNRRRLDFEAMRDALLLVSGELDRRLGGPPVDLEGKEFAARRTIYGLVDRMNLPGLFRTFDFPSPTASSPMRATTTVPPQALYLMNNDFVMEVARRLLARPDVAAIGDRDARVKRIYAVLFARRPTEEETVLGRAFLSSGSPKDRWTEYVHALLLTNEFVFVD